MRAVEPAITEYLHRKASAAKIPLSGTFELTPVCNMNCKMCYVRMTRQQQESIASLRTAQEWLALAAEAKKQGMLYVLLTGGEPFLHPQFREILSGMHQMGFVISINSNGTMIDEDCVRWMLENPPNRINITLYGASNETYERLCGNPQGFTQVTRAIELLTQAGICVKINCSITPHNAHDFEKIVEYARSKDLIVQASSYMFPPLRRDPSMIGRNDRLSPAEAAYYSAKIEAGMVGEEEFLARPDAFLPPMSGEMEEDCSEPGDIMRCRAGRCSFWVTWEGKMMPCGMLPLQVEKNVFTDDFASCWQDAVNYVESIRLPAKCLSCELKEPCHTCAAMVITESGSYQKAPQYRCEMAMAYPAARKRLKDEILKKNQIDVTDSMEILRKRKV